MEKKVVCLDTSVLIEYFRKKDKSKTILLKLLESFDGFVISAITEFEIKYGIKENQTERWDKILDSIPVLPFDSESANIAVMLDKKLKQKRKQIDMADLFIAAITIKNQLKIATLNNKHFERIEDLQLVSI